MAGPKSFRDPVTNRLKCWGFIASNALGDVVRQEPEGFNLDPLDGWEWTGAQWAKVSSVTIAAEITDRQRSVAIHMLASPESSFKLLRAAFDAARDEINVLRQWTLNFKSETAAAASLADFKNRIALLPTLDERTLLQFKNAVENKIGGGSVDQLAAAEPAPAPVGFMAKLKNFFIG